MKGHKTWTENNQRMASLVSKFTDTTWGFVWILSILLNWTLEGSPLEFTFGGFGWRYIGGEKYPLSTPDDLPCSGIQTPYLQSWSWVQSSNDVHCLPASSSQAMLGCLCTLAVQYLQDWITSQTSLSTFQQANSADVCKLNIAIDTCISVASG